LYARDELKKLASEKGVQLSSTLDKNTSLRLRSWRSCQALSSIANTMGDMVNDHKKTSTSFRKKPTKERILMCQKWASKTLPTLKEQLQLAQNTDQQVKQAGKHTR
jgi:Domain of unknown function (DUF4142)